MSGGDDELELGGEFTYVQELPRLQELLRTVSSGASGFKRQDMHGAARVAARETEASTSPPATEVGTATEPERETEVACTEIGEIFERYQLQPALLDPIGQPFEATVAFLRIGAALWLVAAALAGGEDGLARSWQRLAMLVAGVALLLVRFV